MKGLLKIVGRKQLLILRLGSREFLLAKMEGRSAPGLQAGVVCSLATPTESGIEMT